MHTKLPYSLGNHLRILHKNAFEHNFWELQYTTKTYVPFGKLNTKEKVTPFFISWNIFSKVSNHNTLHFFESRISKKKQWKKTSQQTFYSNQPKEKIL